MKRTRPILDHYLAPLSRLGTRTFDALAWLCEALTPRAGATPLATMDRLDDRLARRRRQSFGRRGLLVSWHRLPCGGWLARLSGPDIDPTIERSARSRSLAILRSARAAAEARPPCQRIGSPL